MKFPIILSLLSLLAAPSATDAYNWYDPAMWAKWDAPLVTCLNQAQCLKYSIVENETPTVCGSPCEYRVCWNQGIPFQNLYTWGWQHTCMRTGHVDFIGDMHGQGSINPDDGLCLNPNNPDGKGYWDASCTDPEVAFADSNTYFADVCQNVPAGHTAHIMISDGGACYGTAWTSDFTGMGTYAFCAPSTRDPQHTNWGGKTFFPAHADSGNDGGTCSGMGEGSECVWSVTVPTHCRYEEGDPCPDGRNPNDNHDQICPNQESLLKYYENDRNGSPPIIPIHDIAINQNDTVSFRVRNPFGDLNDIYTVFHEAGGEGDSDCPKQTSATDCLSDDVYTAQCLDDGSWALVTIFVSGFDYNSLAAQLVDQSGGLGTDVYKCCPKSDEPFGRFGPEQTAAFTYLIHCRCPSQQGNNGARALRIGDEVADKLRRAGRDLSADELESKFITGELFDDELKVLYGLS